MLTTIPVIADEAEVKSGPWAEELIFKIYLNPEAEYLALKTGEINIMDWELQPDDVPDALADPNLETASAPDLGYYLIDINCQRWPTSDVHFRRALAHLVDKPRITTDVLQGFGYALDSPVPSIMGGWSNPDIRTYEYNSELAAAELDLGGFTDTDADGIRNDPITGENMAKVLFYIRLDDPNRKQAGEWLAAELKALGVPVEGELALERSVCGDAVMYSTEGAWNVYTGGWGLGYNPTHLADFYHSKQFDPEMDGGWRGYNYPGFVNSTYDYWADIVKTASTFEEVKEAVYLCQEMLAQQVPGIPMYGFVGVKAHSADWTGLINAVDGGIKHRFSILNMHPKDQTWGGRIEYGIKSDIETLNPMTANWEYTWEVLDKIYENPLEVNPLDLSEMWGLLADSWDVEDWTSSEYGSGMMITLHFIENAKWHDGTPFTAEDLEFSYEYIIGQGIPMYMTDLKYIKDLAVVDDYTLEIYLNTTSYFALSYINNVPVVPKHIWEDVGDDWQSYDPVKEGTVIGTGPWKYVESVAGEYYLFEAYENYYNLPTEGKQALKISTLESQLAEATLISEEAAEGIAALGVQLSTLESSTQELLEASADDIESLLSDISSLETEVSSLRSGLSSASNIGYASIGIAIIVGAIAIFMSRRET